MITMVDETYDEWCERAGENIDAWGIQTHEVILLSMQEELGELTQAYLEWMHEDGDEDRIREELDDLAALCIQMVATIDTYGEGE